MNDAQTQMVHVDPELVAKKEVKFTFKKDELGNKRPTVSLSIPYPTLSGVAAILNARLHPVPDEAVDKEAHDAAVKVNTAIQNQKDLLLEAMENIVYIQAREQVNANPEITDETLDTSKLTWEFISNIPPKERRGAGIPKEVWEAFTADYISIMPGLIGRDVEKVTNAATIFAKRYQPVKTVKAVISQLKSYLDIWFANSSNAEELLEVYDVLTKKAEELLAADEAKLLDNI